MPTDPTIINDLRLRVLAGGDISAMEMHTIIEQIRANRRSAAERALTKPTAITKRSTRRLAGDDRADLLDQEV